MSAISKGKIIITAGEITEDRIRKPTPRGGCTPTETGGAPQPKISTSSVMSRSTVGTSTGKLPWPPRIFQGTRAGTLGPTPVVSFAVRQAMIRSFVTAAAGPTGFRRPVSPKHNVKQLHSTAICPLTPGAERMEILMQTGMFIGGAYAHLNQHPVRQEIVDEIKSLTNKWKPREVSQNHFSEIPLK